MVTKTRKEKVNEKSEYIDSFVMRKHFEEISFDTS